MASIEEMYGLFPIILDQRLSYQRRFVNSTLVPFSSAIVFAICLSGDIYIRSLLDEKIGDILKDCEIYPGMEKNKCLDAISELSDYATIYCDNMESATYKEICSLIKRFSNSV